MATVKSSCEECGDVELVTSDLRVRVCISDYISGGEYSFRCPVCGMMVVKPALPRTIDLLVASGVPMDTWSLPAELSEPKIGKPIEPDDLIEFHELIIDPAAFEAALTELLET